MVYCESGYMNQNVLKFIELCTLKVDVTTR